MTYRRRGNFFDDSVQYKNYVQELSRRAAMLDFLALYKMAEEEEIVGKIQFLNQADGFHQRKPQGWETYLTRLLGRCLRHHITEPGAVVKRRNNMIYAVDRRNDIFEPVTNIDKVLRCEHPFQPNYTRYREVGNSPGDYWRTSTLFEDSPTLYDDMSLWYSLFSGSIDLLQRVNLQSWYGVEIRYGQAMSYSYYGMRHGNYHTAEAYREFITLLGLIDGLLGHEDYMRIIFLMQNYDHHRDTANARTPDRRIRQTRILRERIAQHTPHVDAAVTQDRTELRDNFMERLRERGRVT